MKNLVFLFADQWRRTAVGFANADPVYTPNIDNLAKNGVYCTNAVSSCPLCSPHRASLFTGRHPLTTGVFTNCKTGLAMRLSDDEIALGDVLKENGYKTAYIGKWHLDEPELNNNLTPISGAKGWDAYTPEGKSRHGFEYWYSYGACDEHLTPHYWHNNSEQIKVNEWSPIHETDKAIEFISKQTEENPFALVVSYNPPHSPYNLVPDKYLDIYKNKDIKLRENVVLGDLRCHTGEQIGYTEQELIAATKQYFAAVTGVDEQIGRVVDALKSSGMYENTSIVISADHGDMMGSHGLMAKHVWHEESVGIPLIVYGPELEEGICESVIGSADIMPTILEWLNVPCPQTVEGKSYFKQIKAHTTQDNSVSFLCACPGRDVFLEKFKAKGLNPMHFGWRAVRTQKHTYVIEIGYTTSPKTNRLLYNLKEDEFQTSPQIITDIHHNKTAQRLQDMLLSFLETQNDGFLNYIDKELA